MIGGRPASLVPFLVLVLVSLGSALGAACTRPNAFQCASDDQCQKSGVIDGRCEVSSGVCTHADDRCAGGRAYGPGAGSLDDDCLGPDLGADAPPSIDATVDATPIKAVSGRECAPGIALPTTESACVADVCATQPACCTATWSRVCVVEAERRCGVGCSDLMAFGASPGACIARVATGVLTWAQPRSDEDYLTPRVAWGDLDRDGLADLGAAAVHGTTVYRNTGNSTFAVVQHFSLVNGYGAAWGDVTGDHILDLAIGTDDGLMLFRGKERGLDSLGKLGAVDSTNTSVPSPADGVAAGDVNGDGRVDLVSGKWKSPQWLYLGGAQGPTGLFNGRRLEGDHNDVWLVEMCNLDSDPETELVVGDHAFSIMIVDQTPTGLERHDLPTERAGEVHCADLDGDDRLDLVLGGADEKLHALLNQGNLTFTDVPVIDEGAYDFDIGDVDGDRKPDLVLVRSIAQPEPPKEQPIEYRVLHNSSTAPGKLVFAADAWKKVTLSDGSDSKFAMTKSVTLGSSKLAVKP